MDGKLVDLNLATCGEDFVSALHNFGFAIIRNHGISADLLSKVYDGWAKYFQNPDRFQDVYDAVTQNRYYSTQSGYYPFESVDHKGGQVKRSVEYFHAFPDTELTERHAARDTYTMASKLNRLSLDLLEMLDDSGKFKYPLREMAAWSEKTLLRILHYPPVDGTEHHDKRSYGHKDPNLITLIPAPTGPGLQVFHSKQWLNIEMQPGDVFVNIGDMLEIISDGYVKSTLHQVIMPEGEQSKVARYSTPFFVYPHPEVVLREGLTAEQFLIDRLKQLGYN
jgi:isopenicillin N synthase-like dioxygenase